ncbi:MAG: hypothetical protein WC910_11010 [Bacteroidales bacterium]|jgi:hypothetical protein
MAEEKRGQHPNSRKNLVAQPSKEACIAGGKAAAKKRVKNRQIKDTVRYLLNLPVQPGNTQTIKNILEAKSKNLSVMEAMVVAQIKKAVSGDTTAFKALIETSGQKPAEKLEVEGNISYIEKLRQVRGEEM